MTPDQGTSLKGPQAHRVRDPESPTRPTLGTGQLALFPERLRLRAWQESNLQPAASKLEPATIPDHPATSRSVSERGVTRSTVSPVDLSVPADPAPFATALLPDFAGAAPGPSGAVLSPPTARQNGQKRGGAQLKAIPDARPIVLSVSEVAAQRGVCRDTVYRLIERGELPEARVGSLLRVRRPGLEAYLLRQRQGRQ